MVMRTFIDQIPRELDEAAMMDGASQRQVFAGSILPLSAQGMVAVAIFVIVYAWNEFLFAFIFTTKRAKTAPLVMSEMIGSLEGVEWGVLFAATTVQLLPVLDLRRPLPAAPHRGPDRGRHQRITGGYRPWASTEPEFVQALRWAEPALSRFDPLPRIIAFDDFDRGFCGWTQLVGNYEHTLDSMLPGYAQHSQAMLSTLSTWDFGSHGSFDGSYASSSPRSPRRHTERHHQTSHVPQARSGPPRVLLHVQA